MRILAISDTHGKIDALESVFLLHPEADYYIHCGDGERELNSFLMAYPEYTGRTFHVKGNCDWSSVSPTQLVLDLENGHRLVALHGHTLDGGVGSMYYVAQEEKADLVLFGHLHRRHDNIMGRVRIVSPGSAAQPRDGLPPSYALIDLVGDQYVVSHGEVPMGHR